MTSIQLATHTILVIVYLSSPPAYAGSTLVAIPITRLWVTYLNTLIL